MKRKYLIIALLIAVILAIVSYNMLFVKIKVDAVKLQRGNLITVVYATGSVTADTMATLRSEAGGIVKYLNALEGSTVKKGQLLLKTDQADRILNVRRAESDLKTANIELENEKINFERKESLRRTKTISQNDFDEAKKDYQLAELKLQQQQIQLDKEKENLLKTEIYAPFSGIIISSDVNLGDNLSPNSECFEIVAPSSILVQGDVDEQDLSGISIGQIAVVAFDAFPGDNFKSYVYRIVPKTNEETKTSKVYLKLDKIPANLNIGMTATINVQTGKKEDVLLIPRSAILKYADNSYVFLIKNDRLEKVTIETGENNAGNFTDLIRGNLKKGDLIADKPSENWKNGLKVRPVLQ